jgi:transcriptional regulator with XRE-family HTH domain
MEAADLISWREAAGLSREAAAQLLGVSRGTLHNYESGATPIKAKVAEAVYKLCNPQPEDGSEIVQAGNEDTPADIETVEIAKLPNETGRSADIAVVAEVVDPYDLPPGSVGWRYRPGSVLPKGQWTEILPEPVVYANGAVCRAIRWGSNGVGMPKMTLIGSTAEMAEPVHVRGSGFYPLAAGAFKPAEMGDRPEAPKLEPGQMAVGNIKEPYQKGGTKAQHGSVKPKPLMDILDGDE